MENQPDFDLLAQSHRNIADQIGLIANLPAIHDRQLAQNNHNELMGAIRAVQTHQRTAKCIWMRIRSCMELWDLSSFV
jgi:hypothetical protein